jgi:hypothetical protein
LLRDVLAHFNGDAREKKANRVSFLFLYFWFGRDDWAGLTLCDVRRRASARAPPAASQQTPPLLYTNSFLFFCVCVRVWGGPAWLWHFLSQ